VAQDPVAHLVGQVQAPALALEPLDHPQRMPVVAEADPVAPLEAGVEDRLPDVPEGRVPEVVPEPDRLGQVLVQGERSRDRARDPAGLERVGEAGAVVVALGSNEDLGLVLEAPERLRVDDPVAIALERSPERGVALGDEAPGWVGPLRPAVEEALLDRLDPAPERAWALAHQALRDSLDRLAHPPDCRTGRGGGSSGQPWFASDRSQSASDVKPTITASIQYWERTATRARS
jgi:hypothetical protein